MRVGKRALLAGRRVLSAESRDVVMAVALDMRNADQSAERQILLEREPGLRGEVFAAHERRLRLPAVRAARRVNQAFVEALAALARHAGVTHLPRARKRVVGSVRFVDDERLELRQRLELGGQRDLAWQRLLEIER